MINLYKMKPRNLFLLDAFGALTSCLMSGFVLPIFSLHLGIENWIFRSLALVAFSFMIYDLVIYFGFKKIRPWMINVTIFLNLSYCILSGVLMLFLPHITKWGLAVLLVECIVVVLVVAFEFFWYRKWKKELVD